jgi:hypothetical protein
MVFFSFAQRTRDVGLDKPIVVSALEGVRLLVERAGIGDKRHPLCRRY